MKIIFKLVMLFILVLFSSNSYSHQWEIGFRIVNGNGDLVLGYTIGIYTYNLSTGEYDHNFDINTITPSDGRNAFCDQTNYYGEIVTPWGYPLVNYAYRYLFKFGNKCIIFQLPSPDYVNINRYDFSIEFNTDTQVASQYQDNSNPWTTNGVTYNWNDNYSFILKNDFNAGVISLRSMEIPTGTLVTRHSTSFPHTIYPSAHNNKVAEYTRYFKHWKINSGSIINDDLYSLEKMDLDQAKADNEVKAHFERDCDIQLGYSVEGTNKAGYMTIDNTGVYVPNTVIKNSASSVTIDAINQVHNHIIYTFDHWEKNGINIGSSASYTFSPDIHATYTAYLKPLKPTNTYRNLTFKDPNNNPPTPGANIKLIWSGHPDSRVDKYEIWRRVKHNGSYGSATNLAILDSNARSFVDYEYVYTDGYTNDIVDYDVRARLKINGNYSFADAAYETAFGRLEAKTLDDLSLTDASIELPSNYSISNHPNPFNPATIINYQLPSEGFVKLKVYDMLGKEVAELVNENKAAGYYRVNFDASKLASGIYIYSINAGSFSMSKKMILTK